MRIGSSKTEPRMRHESAPKKARDTPSKCAQKRPAKTEQASNNKTPRQRNPMEWSTGNTNDAPSKCAWDTQVIGCATDVPVPRVFHLGQWLRIQQKQKSKVSDYAPSKNKKTRSRCSRSRVMGHTPI